MDNIDHMVEVLEQVNGLIQKINEIPCHPKNKLLLYHRFVLPKISWHFIIADLGKTWSGTSSGCYTKYDLAIQSMI